MKSIDHDNWLQVDTGGKGRVVTVRAWREAFLSIRLDPAVHQDVARMFEAARGGMLYGYYFQPLMAMGVEQCYSVLESGARARCAQAGLPVYCVDSQGKRHPLSFGHNLRALAKAGLIQNADLNLWQQARELRDWVAAPANQAALTLDHGVTALSRAAELLGKLFRA
ncbi:MAG: hypothetical protein B7Y41_10415 [Hydrogenophilales bacterium 28-61-23]|nr:MAG: hypothetical protein B7Y41_10415 [Hydrogenophilales bacterium 28-61-23]